MENQLSFQMNNPKSNSYKEIFHRLFVPSQNKKDEIEEDTPIEVVAEIIAKRMMEAGIKK